MTTNNSQRMVAWWLFAKYQQIPEFIQRNHELTLDGFKFIFWWEWAYRLSGRLIGVVFFLPYPWFLARCRLCGGLAAKVFGFFILGGLQGAMGWYMVKGGLIDDPRVSQYRLAAHLGLAFLIFGLMGWTGLGILQPRTLPSVPSLTQCLGTWLVALVRNGVVGSAGGGHTCRPGLQHISADERTFHAARNTGGGTAVAQLLHQYGDGAV
jgi:cytochrome c oxidase assembly protein subunit 15